MTHSAVCVCVCVCVCCLLFCACVPATNDLVEWLSAQVCPTLDGRADPIMLWRLLDWRCWQKPKAEEDILRAGCCLQTLQQDHILFNQFLDDTVDIDWTSM